MSEGPWLPITSARTLRACAEFPARADDVFVCSYPKSGDLVSKPRRQDPDPKPRG